MTGKCHMKNDDKPVTFPVVLFHVMLTYRSLKKICIDFFSVLNYTIFNQTIDNDIENRTLPPHMTFNNRSLTVIIVYCICFIIAAIGNLTVFVTLSRGRYRKSRIALMICHLSAADLLVTFFMIPLEV